MNNITHTPLAVNIKDESFFKDLGACRPGPQGAQHHAGAVGRHAVGIAQQTLAHYEGGRPRLPASLAQELQIPVAALLGQPSTAKAAAKRGPAPKRAQHMERISALPKTQQKFVMQMIETVLAQQGR